jgi:hypothetical protein
VLKQTYQSLWPGDYERLIAALEKLDNIWDWWLRTPGDVEYCASLIERYDGIGDMNGVIANIHDVGVRPALTISLKP